MLRALQFPSVYPRWSQGDTMMTFETLAVPPLHTQVNAVCGWVYHNSQLLLVREADHNWDLPGGARRAGETFRQTLARVAWEDAGVRLGATRLLGAFRVTGNTEASPQMYTACLLAEVTGAATLSGAFKGHEHALVEPEMLAQMVADWNPLMDEVLAYVEAVHHPTPVVDDSATESAVA